MPFTNGWKCTPKDTIKLQIRTKIYRKTQEKMGGKIQMKMKRLEVLTLDKEKI
jgi:hypothetical protein